MRIGSDLENLIRRLRRKNTRIKKNQSPDIKSQVSKNQWPSNFRRAATADALIFVDEVRSGRAGRRAHFRT